MFRICELGKNLDMDKILSVLLYASVAYLSLFIISKLLGKKQIAELDFIDYVTGISIGSIAAEMATELERPFYLFLISMAVFFVFDFIVSFFGRKSNCLKGFLRGKPIVLISQGKLDFDALKQSKIDFYDLLGLARAKGYFDLAEIEYAIFETNGELSVLATDKDRALKKSDFPEIKPETPSLTYYLVVDGEVSKYALKETEKTKEWVFAELKKQKIEIKQVLYAVFDEKKNTLKITKKEG